MNPQIVTYRGEWYTVNKLGDGYHWRLTDVDNPRQSVTLNYHQMILAGFRHIVEQKS